MDQQLRWLLAPYVVDDPDAPANLSVQVAPPAAPGAVGKPLHRLFAGSTEVLRHRSENRIVDALLSHLATFANEGSDHVILLRGVAAVRGGVAVIGPPRRMGAARALERALHRRGLHVVDGHRVLLERESGQLLTHGVGRDGPKPGTDALVPLGRHRIVGWAVSGRDAEPASRAEALIEALRQVDNGGRVVDRQTFAVLAHNIRTARTASAPADLDARAAAALLARLAAE